MFWELTVPLIYNTKPTETERGEWRWKLASGFFGLASPQQNHLSTTEPANHSAALLIASEPFQLQPNKTQILSSSSSSTSPSFASLLVTPPSSPHLSSSPTKHSRNCYCLQGFLVSTSRTSRESSAQPSALSSSPTISCHRLLPAQLSWYCLLFVCSVKFVCVDSLCVTCVSEVGGSGRLLGRVLDRPPLPREVSQGGRPCLLTALVASCLFGVVCWR